MTDWSRIDPDLHVPGTEARTGMTVFLYGGLGTWKTTWAGTWPNPVFLSAGSEGGDDALAMLPHLTQGQVQTPPSYRITTCKQLLEKTRFIASNYEKIGFKTVVVDSISFMVDMWMTELLNAKRDKVGDKGLTDAALAMHQRDWGFLENFFLKNIAQTLHKTRLNVIWIALERERTETAPNGDRTVVERAPYIQGGTGAKLPAMCKLIIHADKVYEVDPANPSRRTVRPVYWTSPSRLTPIIRHKYGPFFPEGQLVDPQYGTWPTFDAVNSKLGQFIYQ